MYKSRGVAVEALVGAVFLEFVRRRFFFSPSIHVTSNARDGALIADTRPWSSQGIAKSATLFEKLVVPHLTFKGVLRDAVLGPSVVAQAVPETKKVELKSGEEEVGRV